MPYTLVFDRTYPYGTTPLVPIPKPRVLVTWLSLDLGRSFDLNMLVDSGADVTCLPSTLINYLGIDRAALVPVPNRGVGGVVQSYRYDRVPMRLGGIGVLCPVLFVDDLPDLLLGRATVFDYFCFAFEQSAWNVHIRLPTSYGQPTSYVVPPVASAGGA